MEELGGSLPQLAELQELIHSTIGKDQPGLELNVWTSKCEGLLRTPQRFKDTAVFLFNFLLWGLFKAQPDWEKLKRLRALGELYTEKWLATPRSGSRPVVTTLAIVANACSILQLRLDLLGGYKNKASAFRNLRGFNPTIAFLLSRGCVPCPTGDDAGNLFCFIAEQAQCLVFRDRLIHHESIYWLRLASNNYVGRTHLVHDAPSGVAGGLTIRWEHYVRQLHLHFHGTIRPGAKRARYKTLLQVALTRFALARFLLM